jgi:predicted patatin/cPLA2 family phospholipase
VATLKSAHLAELAKGTTEASSAYEKQLAELTQQHEASNSELQSKIETAAAAQTALEASHKQRLDSQQTESAAAISKLEQSWLLCRQRRSQTPSHSPSQPQRLNH